MFNGAVSNSIMENTTKCEYLKIRNKDVVNCRQTRQDSLVEGTRLTRGKVRDVNKMKDGELLVHGCHELDHAPGYKTPQRRY
jgi:enhancing lycopene biosynthesis protein 2